MEVKIKFGGDAHGDAIMLGIKIIGIVGYEDVRTGGGVEKWRWWRMIFHMEVA